MEEYIKNIFTSNRSYIELAPNEYLYRRGNSADRLFCLESGSLMRIQSEGDTDKQIALDFVPKGEVIGLEGFKSGIYEVDVKALTPVRVAFVAKAKVEELMHQDFNFKLAVLKVLCQQVALVQNRGLKVLNKNVRQRLALILLEIQKAYGQTSEIHFPIEEMAHYLGTSLRNLRRTLEDLNQEGFIIKDGNKVRVLKPEEIELSLQA